VDTIKMDPAEVGREVVDLIHMAQVNASGGLLGTYLLTYFLHGAESLRS